MSHSADQMLQNSLGIAITSFSFALAPDFKKYAVQTNVTSLITGNVICLALVNMSFDISFILKTWLWLGAKPFEFKWTKTTGGLNFDHNSVFELLSVLLIFNFSCDAQTVL